MATEETWEKIRTEYITQGKKPVELSKKYRVSKNDIYQRAKDEDWKGKKGNYREETGEKIIEAVQKREIDDALRLVTVGERILDRVEEILEIGHIKHMTPTGLKNLSEVVLNIKELKNIRSAEDIEEQRARIDKLRREADRDDRSASITVTLEGAMDSYGE